MKLKPLLLWFYCTIIISTQMFSQLNAQQVFSVVNKSEFQSAPRAVSPVARQAMQKGDKPGSFLNVQEKFTERVVLLTRDQKESIYKNMKIDGLLTKSSVPGFTPEPGKIYLDPESDLVMQFESISDADLLVFRPQMHQVFETFTIPNQEVKLTAANTTSTIENSKITTSGVGENYNIVMHFDSVSYKYIDGKDTLKIAFLGDIKFNNPRIEGHFSKNNGYNLVFKTSEAIDLKVYSNVKFTKEIKEPLWGFEIEAGKYGKCELGIFLVIEVSGDVSLVVKVDQGFDLTAGVKGGTCYYVPTSVRPVLEVNNWCTIDYNLSGKINAFAGVQCQTVLKVKGYSALDIKARAGFEGSVLKDGNYLEGDLGMRMKIYGKAVYKNFTLLDKYYSFFRKKEFDYGNFDLKILEACAYRDYVIGRIVKADTKAPYTGELILNKKTAVGVNTSFQGQTNSDGYFVIKDVPLEKGDQVAVKVGESPFGRYVEPTIPFTEVKLFYADYFTGEISGMVAGGVSQYEDLLKTTGTNTRNARVTMASTVANPRAQSNRNKLSLNNQSVERIEQLQSRLLAYNGPVEIIREEIDVAFQPMQAIGTGRSVPSGVSQRMAGVGAQAPAVAGKVKRPESNKATTISPMGIFTIYQNELMPSERVKTFIKVEGFIVESDWVETDGIMVAPIEIGVITRSGAPGTVTFKGDDMLLMVSAFRSETAPQGNIRIAKGTDMVHAGIQTPYATVEAMPQLKKPFVWFDKVMPLQPVKEIPGLSTASTGAWSSTLQFTSPAEALNPAKNSGHDFELISFILKNRETGYFMLAEKCSACTSTTNYVKNLNELLINNNRLSVDPSRLEVPSQINRKMQQKGPGGRF